jgi:predicted 3-demethylubiquinone-9 3-methyltransferase (glyoxalase superfamily)
MKKVTTFLWFNDQAHEAAKFYVSVFPGAKLLGLDAMSARFDLGGQEYIAFNGGPHFTLTPAVSLFVDCPTQAEIDALWDKLLAGGGTESRCGWLVDRFGLSWQVVPAAVMAETIGNADPAKAKRSVDAMMTMAKLDIAALKAARDGV